MKKIAKYLLFVFIFLCPFAAKSETITYGGIVYEVINETHVRPLEIDPSATKIIITDCVEGHEVFDLIDFLGSNGFGGSNINTVEIDTTDDNCPLAGGSVSPWNSYNSDLSKFSNLKTIIIGSRMSAIPTGLCMGCPSLVKVVFSGAGVRKIGINAFRYCSSLSDITIPESVTEIGASAFCGCSSLSDINLPESVTEIVSNTFAGCGFSSVRIPESVIEIGPEAFARCNLESVTIPKGTKLHYGVFKECTSLEKVIFSGDNEIEDKDEGWYGSLFDGCTALKEVDFGNAHGELQTYCFRGCKSLESLTIPDGLSLGSLVFEDAVIKHLNLSGNRSMFQSEDPYGASLILQRASIESITIGEGAKIIPYDFRANHIELKNVNLPSTLEKICDRAFSDCTLLNSINIPESLREIGSAAFQGCKSLTNIDLSESLESIGNNAFKSCTSLSEIILYDNLKDIGDNAFSDTSLKELLLPNSLEQLGSGALRGTLLTTLTIPYKVTIVGDNLCRDCKNLKRVILPANLERVGSEAFYNCESLTSIILPSTVNNIGYSAFWGCTSLNTVSCLALIPPSAKGAFFSIDDEEVYASLDHTKISLMVPAKALGEYFRADEWEKFGIHDGRIWPRHDGGASIRYEYFHSKVIDAPVRQCVSSFAEDDYIDDNLNSEDDMVILAGKGTSVKFHITPIEGEQVVKVTYNDEDITDQMADNTYVVDSIGDNDTLNVVTTKSGQPTSVESVLSNDCPIKVVNGQIMVPEAYSGSEYYIYDIAGRLINILSHNSITLPKGIYIIRTAEGSGSIKIKI